MRDQHRNSARSRRSVARRLNAQRAGTIRLSALATSPRWLALAALLAVATVIAGSGAGRATPTHALALGVAAPNGAAGALQWRATGTRTSAAWRDPVRHTAFSIGPSPNAKLARFVFVESDGSEVVGSSIQLTSTLTQLSILGPGDPYSAVQSFCTVGELMVTSAAASAQVGGPANGYTIAGLAWLRFNIGQGGLIAYAAATFEPGPGAACNNPPNGQWGEMVAGCMGLNGPADCTPPAPPATASTSYGSAFSSAVQSHNWSTVYGLNSQLVQAQYSEASFASLMNQDAAQYGQITGISAPLSTPQIGFDGDGQPYFIATQRLTLTGSGTTTRQISSYFLLEGGTWRFWFSL
jgi:hypothetical protein